MHQATASPLIGQVLESIIRIVRGEVGAVFALDDAGALHGVVEWGLREDVARQIVLRTGEPLLEKAMAEGTLLMIPEARGPGGCLLPAGLGEIRSLVCLPLSAGEAVLGAALVVNANLDHILSDDEIDLLNTSARLMAAQLDNERLQRAAFERQRLEDQLELASRIQRQLLPLRTPALPGFLLAGINTPCECVGGDYFDYIAGPDGSLLVTIGDATHHGLGPALLMSTARAFLRALVRTRSAPATLLAELNNLLAEDMADDTFMTMLLARLRPGRNTVEFANAGHDPLILLRRDGELIELPASGPPLGILPNAAFPAGQVELKPGDVLAFTTDGAWEAINGSGEMLGRDRLRQVVRANAWRRPEEIIGAIRHGLDAHLDGCKCQDDVTLVVVKKE